MGLPGRGKEVRVVREPQRSEPLTVPEPEPERESEPVEQPKEPVKV